MEKTVKSFEIDSEATLTRLHSMPINESLRKPIGNDVKIVREYFYDTVIEYYNSGDVALTQLEANFLYNLIRGYVIVPGIFNLNSPNGYKRYNNKDGAKRWNTVWGWYRVKYGEHDISVADMHRAYSIKREIEFLDPKFKELKNLKKRRKLKYYEKKDYDYLSERLKTLKSKISDVFVNTDAKALKGHLLFLVDHLRKTLNQNEENLLCIEESTNLNK